MYKYLHMKDFFISACDEKSFGVCTERLHERAVKGKHERNTWIIIITITPEASWKLFMQWLIFHEAFAAEKQKFYFTKAVQLEWRFDAESFKARESQLDDEWAQL